VAEGAVDLAEVRGVDAGGVHLGDVAAGVGEGAQVAELTGRLPT